MAWVPCPDCLRRPPSRPPTTSSSAPNACRPQANTGAWSAPAPPSAPAGACLGPADRPLHRHVDEHDRLRHPHDDRRPGRGACHCLLRLHGPQHLEACGEGDGEGGHVRQVELMEPARSPGKTTVLRDSDIFRNNPSACGMHLHLCVKVVHSYVRQPAA